jgi:hypothetical protein
MWLALDGDSLHLEPRVEEQRSGADECPRGEL